MECKCGKAYPMELLTLPDGTVIYYCIDCKSIWGERLVKFAVMFNLNEMKDGGNGRHPESAFALPRISATAERAQ